MKPIQSIPYLLAALLSPAALAIPHAFQEAPSPQTAAPEADLARAAALWARGLLPEGQAPAPSSIARALATLEMDLAATGKRDVALARSDLLVEIVQQQSPNELGNPALAPLYLRHAELLLEAGRALDAWNLLRVDARQAPAFAQQVDAANALRQRIQQRLNSLTPGKPAPQDALEEVLRRSLRDRDLTQLRSIGANAMPILERWVREDLDGLTFEGLDPLGALALIDNGEAVSLALELFGTNSAVFKSRVVTTVAPILPNIFQEPEHSAWRAAADQLAAALLMDPATRAPCLAITFRNTSFTGPRMAAAILGELENGPPSVHPAFDQLTQGLIIGLAERNELEQYRERLLSLPQANLRLEALQILQFLGRSNPEARTLAYAFAGDPDVEVRRELGKSFPVTADRAALKVLAALLRDADDKVRTNTVEYLARDPANFEGYRSGQTLDPLGDPEVLVALGEQARRMDRLDRGEWFQILKRLSVPEGAAIARSLMATEDPSSLSTVCQWLLQAESNQPKFSQWAVALAIEFLAAIERLNGSKSAEDMTSALISSFTRDLSASQALLVGAADRESLRALQLALGGRILNGSTGSPIVRSIAQFTPDAQRALVAALVNLPLDTDTLVKVLENKHGLDGKTLIQLPGLAKAAFEKRFLIHSAAFSLAPEEALDGLLALLKEPNLIEAYSGYMGGNRAAEWLAQSLRYLSTADGDALNRLARRTLEGAFPDWSVQFAGAQFDVNAQDGLGLGRELLKRFGANKRLGDQSPPVLYPILIEMGKSPEFFDREWIARGLDSPRFRYVALQALLSRGRPEDKDLVQGLLDSRVELSDNDYGSLIDLGTAIGGSAGLDVLIQLAGRLAPETPSHEACFRRIDELKRLEEARSFSQRLRSEAGGQREALGELRQLLSSPDFRVRTEAVRGLGTLGLPEALPDLIRLLPTAEGELRQAISEALDRLNAIER